jgi:hypothetical protein
VAGSDPIFWREYHAKIPSGFGGRSRHRGCALQANFPPIPRPQCRKFRPSRSTVLTCTTPSPTEENAPCLY